MIIQMQQTRQIDVCTQQSTGNISTIPNCRLIQWRRRFGEQPPTECYSSKTNAQTTKIAGTKNIKFVIFAKWQNDASRHYIAIHGAQCARLSYCLLPSRLYFPAPAWTACLRCFHVYLFGLFREKKNWRIPRNQFTITPHIHSVRAHAIWPRLACHQHAAAQRSRTKKQQSAGEKKIIENAWSFACGGAAAISSSIYWCRRFCKWSQTHIDSHTGWLLWKRCGEQKHTE